MISVINFVGEMERQIFLPNSIHRRLFAWPKSLVKLTPCATLLLFFDRLEQVEPGKWIFKDFPGGNAINVI
jgi:hypothetical protein